MVQKSLCARAQEKSRPKRFAEQLIAFGGLRIAAFINCAALVTACVFLLINGAGALNWEFVFDAPRKMMTEGGVWPCLVGTFLLAAGAIAIALPFGVACAVWLNEYSKDGAFKSIVRLSVANLAGVPSIVFGLFGLAFFVTALGFNVSLLSGILTLAVLTLPVIINTTEEALKQVPGAWREASLALGATKSQTIGRVVLPAALPGILTGAILAVARAAGETSAVMFTAAVFYTPKLPESVFNSVMALPYHMYVLATAGTEIEKTRPLQYSTGLLLVLLVFAMNLAAIFDPRQDAEKTCGVRKPRPPYPGISFAPSWACGKERSFRRSVSGSLSKPSGGSCPKKRRNNRTKSRLRKRVKTKRKQSPV